MPRSRLWPYRDAIAEALDAGTSQTNLARTYGVGRATMSYFINRHLHADPEWLGRKREQEREQKRELRRDPENRDRERARERDRLRDPEKRARKRKRERESYADGGSAYRARVRSNARATIKAFGLDLDDYPKFKLLKDQEDITT